MEPAAHLTGFGYIVLDKSTADYYYGY